MSNTESTATDVIKNKKSELPDTASSNTELSNTESTTENFVIPLVLLLVSAIVIVATFYQDEYVDMLASSDSPLTLAETSDTNKASNKAVTDSSALLAFSHEAKNTNSDQVANNLDAVATSQTTAQAALQTVIPVSAKTSTSVSENSKDTNHSLTIAETNISEKKTDNLVTEQIAKKVTKQTQSATIPAVTPLTLTASPQGSTKPDSPNKMNHKSVNKQKNERLNSPVQQQLTKHKEFMLQRRQAYEKEMQSRRQQYEAAIKARKDKKAQIIEAKNALYIRVQQHHSETRQTIEQARKHLAELHEELYQIMMQSRKTRPQSAATQIKDIEIEKM